MSLQDGKLALDIVDDRMMKDDPSRSALFLIAVMYDYLTSNQLNGIKWRHIDLDEGVIRVGNSLAIMLPDLIWDLLEDARLSRPSESQNQRVFPLNNKPGMTATEALAEIRTLFADYRDKNLLPRSAEANRGGMHCGIRGQGVCP